MTLIDYFGGSTDLILMMGEIGLASPALSARRESIMTFKS